MAELLTLDRDAPIDAVVAALRADGGVIVRELLSPEGRATIVDELQSTYAATEPGSKSGTEPWETFHGRSTKRFCGLAARSRAFVDHALLDPVMLAVADALLLPHATSYWLNTGQVMAIGPGESAQYLHRDENNWPEVIATDREITVSCLYALSDFTVHNGATIVLPGTHRLPAGTLRGGLDPTPDEIAHSVMSAGSGMIYTGKVIHGAGANQTDTWRYGMHVSFVVGWLRPEEASPLHVDRATAATLPARARELLGWGSYHSDGGGRTWLYDFEDASALFDENPSS